MKVGIWKVTNIGITERKTSPSINCEDVSKRTQDMEKKTVEQILRHFV